ncbi:MAG: glutamine-hydrolyzing GMP synthase [Heliobacteriaceae bacterium]|jgi:GMP synthase (glutamine-hydrolysing)|nr:glutamine-hydrolyzing GMP synthase [Heliobacteriaceae bacterium]
MTNDLQKVLILDFGSQYTQLIARTVREMKVYCEIHPFNMSFEGIKKYNPAAVIFSGGPCSVYEEGAPGITKEIFELGVPVLGICYGMQLITSLFGGKVASGVKKEYGQCNMEILSESRLFKGLDKNNTVLMSHGDAIEVLPEGYRVTAKSGNTPYCAIENEEKNVWAIQFHPEVVQTVNGEKILANFVFNIANIRSDWNMDNFIKMKTEEIRETTGDKKVILGLSGGVDSSVAAVLIHRAIGKNLKCIFVNNGVLRLNEAQKVVQLFKGHYDIDLTYVDAGNEFLGKLKGVEDPEKKRKIIGHQFIEVFDREAKKFHDAAFLAQGTLYPDVIESVSFKGPSDVIKSHHNVGGLPEKMNLKLLEPFRELFKDEVREIGSKLGMPDEIIHRQPFPGPGLAVRIIGEVTPERVKVLQLADDIVVAEIKKAGLYHKLWQAFAVLLPIKTVGVMGDLRTYESVCAIRAVESRDAMTAKWAEIPYETLDIISKRIINEVSGINRVVYDISSKPPATIEWE